MSFLASAAAHELQFTADGQSIADPCGLDLSGVPPENLYESAESVPYDRRIDPDLEEALGFSCRIKTRVGGLSRTDHPSSDADVDSMEWFGDSDIDLLVVEDDLFEDEPETEDEIDTDDLEPPLRAGATVRSDRDPSSGRGRKFNKPFDRRGRLLLARP
jgi:hypothetical protein